MGFLITILFIGFITSLLSFRKRGNVSDVFSQEIPLDQNDKGIFDDGEQKDMVFETKKADFNKDKQEKRTKGTIVEKSSFDLKKAIIMSAILERPY